jgi:hypothetical protein
MTPHAWLALGLVSLALYVVTYAALKLADAEALKPRT